MRVICVDDENLILQLTVKLCSELPQFSDVQGFLSAEEALSWLDDHKADVALLDIDMPEMDGLTLAAKIKERSPDTAIIFQTGYSQYAVDAFALHASGYLLKPVSKEKIEQEVQYVLQNRSMQRSAHIRAKTFGSFDIFVDGEIVVFPRAKSKELLAYLIDRQGCSVSRVEAFASLWEDAAYDRPMQKQLDVIIRSLRSTLAEYNISEILELKSGYMRVNSDLIDCDLYRFFEGDIDAVNAFRGEYMSAYPWASLTEAYIDQKKRNSEYSDY